MSDDYKDGSIYLNRQEIILLYRHLKIVDSRDLDEVYMKLESFLFDNFTISEIEKIQEDCDNKGV
ncbi:hypothetical protein [Spirochaeta cellobiosiphila]|uniref:hypothetical protein n=1 Tax=Spirochaeta cellobiosiphila TaxID=504483 RepID=UPI0003F97AB9|nr:hypothetical protein [Spirochaeta cellobiosiphila]